MKPSDLYVKLTKKRAVYNIMPIENIHSVIQHGLLSFNQSRGLAHRTIAMSEVQAKRNQVHIPNGLALHDYANLYFAYNNPMLYKRKSEAESLCILAFSCRLMDIDGCVFSDRNAASPLARFYIPQDGINNINFDKVFAKYWTNSSDPYVNEEHKKIKCAEVLVPYCAPTEHIMGAYVINQKAEERLKDEGFTAKIVVDASVFYR